MATIPDCVCEEWKKRKGAVVLVTMDPKGMPNAIYATCVSMFEQNYILIADNYFDKTRTNLVRGNKKGAVLFISEDGKAYQIKGELEYLKEGKFFDDMKKWNPPKHPGHAVVVLNVEEIYSGAKKLV